MLLKDIMDSKIQKKILNSEFYLEDITGKLKYIEACPICNIKKNSKIINVPERLILNNCPHIEYQMDLFYLTDDLVNKTNYKYIYSIIGHFSKWI